MMADFTHLDDSFNILRDASFDAPNAALMKETASSLVQGSFSTISRSSSSTNQEISAIQSGIQTGTTESLSANSANTAEEVAREANTSADVVLDLDFPDSEQYSSSSDEARDWIVKTIGGGSDQITEDKLLKGQSKQKPFNEMIEQKVFEIDISIKSASSLTSGKALQENI